MSDCLLKLDWEKIRKEYDCLHSIEEVITNNINIAIEELVQRHITNTNVIDINYIKEEYSRGLDKLRAIRYIRYLTKCSLREAKDLVDSWSKT